MNRHRPGDRVRLRRGRVAHVVATGSDDGPRFTLCGVPVLMDDQAAVDTDPDCVGCYNTPSTRRTRHVAHRP